MPTRNGKIANLPNDIREQLNLRLLEGENGPELAAWLNALPEVQSILASQFNASPISEVNLTHWRQGGYLQWFTERECFDSARALADGDSDLAQTGLSAERLLNVLTVRFGQLLMRWDLPSNESGFETAAFSEMAKKARILQGISRSLLAIHRIQSKSASQKSVPASSSANSSARAREIAFLGSALNSSAEANGEVPFRQAQGPEPVEGLAGSMETAEPSWKGAGPATAGETAERPRRGAAPAPAAEIRQADSQSAMGGAAGNCPFTGKKIGDPQIPFRSNYPFEHPFQPDSHPIQSPP